MSPSAHGGASETSFRGAPSFFFKSVSVGEVALFREPIETGDNDLLREPIVVGDNDLLLVTFAEGFQPACARPCCLFSGRAGPSDLFIKHTRLGVSGRLVSVIRRDADETRITGSFEPFEEPGLEELAEMPAFANDIRRCLGPRLAGTVSCDLV